MKAKAKLEFDELGYNDLKNRMIEIGSILTDAKNELQKLEVKCQIKDLANGNFLDEFHNHHRKAQKQEKESFAKRLTYEKYIEMLGYDLAKIEVMQEEYKAKAFRYHEYYAFNHNFYTRCKNAASKDSMSKEHLKSAPKVKVFRAFDLFVFDGDKVDVDLDADLFTVYAANDKQIDMMKDIEQFVELSRKIGLTYHDINPHYS